MNGVLSALLMALLDALVQVKKMEDKLMELFEQLSIHLLALEGATGRHLSDGDEELPPTLWELVASLWMDSPDEGGVSAEGEAMPEGYQEKLMDLLRGLNENQNGDEEQRKKLLERLQLHETQAGKIFKALSDKLGEVVKVQNNLAKDLQAVGSLGMVAPLLAPPSGIDSLLSTLDGVPKSNVLEVKALRSEMAVLQTELKLLKNEETDESVQVGGVTFHMKEDLHAWMLENIPDGPFGAFVDFHQLLQQIYFDMKGYENNEDILKSLKLRNDLDIMMNGDILTLAALHNNIPPLLGNGKTLTGVDRSQFYALHTFNDWKSTNNQDGLTQQLPSYMSVGKRAIGMDILN